LTSFLAYLLLPGGVGEVMDALLENRAKERKLGALGWLGLASQGLLAQTWIDLHFASRRITGSTRGIKTTLL
jgi:hypothetical protein